MEISGDKCVNYARWNY
ncbi:hypothetical protein RDI58_005541 [Solanum bulbocastanum]|uniref:Uncharacterized protein n=1 Tax=Solanum bulbocastanum TaxID=147425 RepID=A0AAN8U3F2_SOLBU